MKKRLLILWPEEIRSTFANSGAVWVQEHSHHPSQTWRLLPSFLQAPRGNPCIRSSAPPPQGSRLSTRRGERRNPGHIVNTISVSLKSLLAPALIKIF